MFQEDKIEQNIEPKNELNKQELPEQKKSKNQMKKQLKQQKYLEKNKIKRQQDKIKQKIKRKEKRLQNSSEQIEENENTMNQREFKRKFKEVYKESMQSAPVVIIDCSFSSLLAEKEIKSLVNQLTYCQNMNTNSKQPRCDSQFLQILNSRGAQGWGVKITHQDIAEIYQKDQLIYLTGDADQEMEEFVQQKVYVIGGMVDHNRLKNVSLDKANKLNLETRRFPINDQTVNLKSSSILTVNTVYDIMLKKYNGESWKDALISSIPKRKQVHLEENIIL